MSDQNDDDNNNKIGIYDDKPRQAILTKSVSWEPSRPPYRPPSPAPTPKYTTPTTAPAKVPAREYEAMIDEVIEKFSNLSLANRQTLKSRVMSLTRGEGSRISVVNAVTALIVEYTAERQTPYSRDSRYQQKNFDTASSSQYMPQSLGPPAFRCYYCDQSGHSTKTCEALAEDRSIGVIHYNAEGKRVVGTASNPGPIIPAYTPARNGLSEKDWVHQNQPQSTISGSSRARMYSEYRNCIEKKARITTVSDDESSTETPTARVDPKRSRASGSESGGKAKNPTKRRRSIDTTVIPREAIITNEPKITHEGKPWVPRKKPTLESPDSQIRLKKLGLEFSVSRDHQNTCEIQVTDRDHEVFGTRHQSLDATAEKPIPSVATRHIFPEYDSKTKSPEPATSIQSEDSRTLLYQISHPRL